MVSNLVYNTSLLNIVLYNVGTKIPNEFPCPAGTYSDRSGNVRIQDCLQCTVGHYCPAGSVLPSPCLPGTYSNRLGVQVQAYT